MGVQTSYNYGICKGIAGGLYDITNYENNTFITPGGIPFGYGVVKGTSPEATSNFLPQPAQRRILRA